jgi:signal peptidase I
MKARASVLFAVIAFIAFTGCQRAVQSSGGMAPTIKPGERVTVDYLAYAVAVPRRWDVVALEPPGFSNLVVLKRVIALPFETISVTTHGIVVNGNLLNIPTALSNVTYCPPEKLSPVQGGSLITFPYTVPPQHYFVVGDNWTNSLDSRNYGAVAATNIFGKVKNK